MICKFKIPLLKIFEKCSVVCFTRMDLIIIIIIMTIYEERKSLQMLQLAYFKLVEFLFFITMSYFYIRNLLIRWTNFQIFPINWLSKANILAFYINKNNNDKNYKQQQQQKRNPFPEFASSAKIYNLPRKTV